MIFLQQTRILLPKAQQMASRLARSVMILCATLCAIAMLAACQFPALQQSLPKPSAKPNKAAEWAVEKVAALPVAQALPPVLFQLPELDIEFNVVPMGWTIVDKVGVDKADVRTTRWVLPVDAAGWHVNSVGAGGAGNTILSGQQAVGEAVFAPLALGEILTGQQILLSAEDGTVYAYTVTEVSQPIPIVGATEADKEAAVAYIASTDEARLTLITGWPDFSTTHRIFAVAELIGQAKPK